MKKFELKNIFKCYPFGGRVSRPASAEIVSGDNGHGGAVPAEHMDSRNCKMIGGRVPRPARTAFTLSEVLITLGIIGVVAALTIPSIMKNYRNKLYTAQLKKTYVQLEDAISNIKADEHSQNFYETTAGVAYSAPNAEHPEGKGAYYFLNNYFKTIKTGCTSAAGTNQCFAPAYTSIDGAASGTLFGGYCVQTTSGAAICMLRNETNHVVSISIDINGPADPNIAGRDAFVFNLDPVTNKLVDWSSDPDKCGTKASNYGHIADYATGCVTKIIDSGWNMTY